MTQKSELTPKNDSIAPQMAFDIFKTLAKEMEGQFLRAVEIMGEDDIYE